MDFISPALRLGFREFCVGLSLSQIDSIFQAAGLQPAQIDSQLQISGARRTRVEEYYAGVNWARTDDARKVLQVVSLALSQSYLSEAAKGELRELCTKEGLVVDGHIVRLGEALGVDWFLAADGRFDRPLFSRYCERIQQSVVSDPAAAVGSAKELVEAVARHVLEQRGKPAQRDDFPQLLKAAIKELGLAVEDIPEATKGAEAIKRILAAFGQIVAGMAELRNLYGTGHGRPGSTRAIAPRHAKLAVGAAVTLATFLLETLHERDLRNATSQ